MNGVFDQMEALPEWGSLVNESLVNGVLCFQIF